MNFSQLSEKILSRCPEVLRQSWKPLQACGNLSSTSTVTKFGGADPFRPKNFTWPKCPECLKQKAFICQIDVEKLPSNLKHHIKRTNGLFQCFFCIECMPYDGCFDDIYFVPGHQLIPNLQSLVYQNIFKNNICAEKLPKALKSSLLEYNEVYQQWVWERFEERQVIDLVENKREFPRCEEITESEDSNLSILNKIGISRDELIDIEHEDKDEDDTSFRFPNRGIKLGGYIRWCQGPEYPTCPDCKIKMTVTFLQMEYDSLFSCEWGDSGTAHVTLCPQCGRPGLGWA